MRIPNLSRLENIWWVPKCVKGSRQCNEELQQIVASKSSKGPKIFLGVPNYAYRSYEVVQTIVDGEVAAQILLTPDTFHCYTGIIHTDYAANSQDHAAISQVS